MSEIWNVMEITVLLLVQKHCLVQTHDELLLGYIPDSTRSQSMLLTSKKTPWLSIRSIQNYLLRYYKPGIHHLAYLSQTNDNALIHATWQPEGSSKNLKDRWPYGRMLPLTGREQFGSQIPTRIVGSGVAKQHINLFKLVDIHRDTQHWTGSW